MSTNPMPPGRYEEAMERDRGCKAWDHGLTTPCERRLVVHHIEPGGMGRKKDHSLDNLLVLCDGHHVWVHAHPKDARELGLLR